MRTTTKIISKYPFETVKESLSKYLIEQGYQLTTRKKESIWKKGMGLLTAPEIFKFYTEDDKVCIDSWVPFALFPGVYIGESGLDNNAAIIVKKPMRAILSTIIKTYKLEESEVIGYNPLITGKKK